MYIIKFKYCTWFWRSINQIFTLFAVLWLVAGADLLWEKNTAGWLIASADLVWEKNTVGWLERTKWTINDLTRSDFISTQWTKPKMRYSRRTDEGEPPLNICGRLLANGLHWYVVKVRRRKMGPKRVKRQSRRHGRGERRMSSVRMLLSLSCQKEEINKHNFLPLKKSTIFWMRTWFR